MPSPASPEPRSPPRPASQPDELLLLLLASAPATSPPDDEVWVVAAGAELEAWLLADKATPVVLVVVVIEER